MTIDETLQLAVRYHQSGRLAEAEALYRQVLNYDPNQPDVLHFLGVLAGQTGHPKDAIQLIRRSLAIQPKNADAHSNLGRILADQRDFDSAVASYRQAAKLRPTEASAWFALGIVWRSSGDNDQAVSAFEKAIGINPSFAEAYTELGNLFRSKGQVDAAIEAHSKAVSLKPNSADAHNNFGNALIDQGRIEEAIAEFMSAVQLDFEKAVFHSNLASALTRVERDDEALIAYDCAISRDQTNVDALTGKGAILSKLRQFDEADRLFARSLELAPDHLGTLLARGDMFLEKREMRAAEENFKRALELDPRSVAALTGLGTIIERSEGNFEEAAKYFRQALEIEPNNALAYKTLAGIGFATDPEFERLENIRRQKGARDEERVAAGFALGKLLDDAERFDEAFERYSEANALCRSMQTKEGDRFDGPGLRSLVDRQIEAFPAGYFSSTREWGNPTELPVFIVGMPRSGTTLVEQIAASHPNVFGAGELREVGDIAREFFKEQQEFGGRWNRSMVSREANAHYQRLAAMAPGAARVVDKMPSNLLNLAIIADLFPNARVIFCQRDPRDICLSCYFQWFAKNSLIFTYDLQECATQYLEQERLAAHWMKNLPLRMLPVQYEEMVGDLEGQSRRLIEFLGLEWDAKCLEFHKTKRAVSTASVWQVRQPIYNSSVGRWRHYEKHLGPLLAALKM